MGHASDAEGVGAVRPDLDRRVQKLVQIAGQPATLGTSLGTTAGIDLRQGHEGLPPGRQLEPQAVGRPALPLQLQGHRCQGQKAVVAVEVAGAHRELRGKHRVADLEGLKAGQLQLPAAGTGTPGLKAAAGLSHRQRLQLADVIPDQVGAWGPGGQGQAQAGTAWGVEEADPHQVLVTGCEIQVKRRHGLARAPTGVRAPRGPGPQGTGWPPGAGPSQRRSAG